MKFINKHKNMLLSIFIVYCVALSIGIIGSSMPYGSDRAKLEDNSVQFSANWKVYEDGVLKQEAQRLPYYMSDKNCKIVDIYNTIQATPFETSILVTNVFQKNITVFVEHEMIYEYRFESKSPISKTPGSGRFYINLPDHSQGKTIHIQYERVVPEDLSAIADIVLINAMASCQLYIPNRQIVVLVITAMFIIGAILLIISAVIRSSKVKATPLICLALFCVSAAIWFLCNSKMLQFFTGNLVLIHNLEYICFYLIPVALWAFMWSNWKYSPKVTLPMIITMSVFFASSLTLKILGICDFFSLITIFHVLVCINILVFGFISIQGLRSKDFSIKLIFIGFLILCVGGLLDIIGFNSAFNPQAIPIYFIFGIFLMCLCIAISFLNSSRRDFKERIENEMYKVLAYTDALTKINNRLMFEEDIEAIQENIQNYDTIIIVNLDVNNFKLINDTYGHPQGDFMLKTIANELVAVFSDVAKCYRIGGDEFCLVATNHSIEEINGRLTIVDNNLKNKKFEHAISLSYGLTEYDELVHEGLQDVFKNSDEIMYKNKRLLKKSLV
ncbi:MAG: diguanylate cyclase [Oscillospiraceae bacterium]